MDAHEETYLLISGMIVQLPEEEQAKIKQCAVAINKLVDDYRALRDHGHSSGRRGKGQRQKRT